MSLAGSCSIISYKTARSDFFFAKLSFERKLKDFFVTFFIFEKSKDKLFLSFFFYKENIQKEIISLNFLCMHKESYKEMHKLFSFLRNRKKFNQKRKNSIHEFVT